MPHKMALRFDADPRTLRAVRRFVHGLFLTYGGSEEDALAVEVATGEVLANAYQHGYAGRSGPLEVDLLYDEAKLELTIRNHGPITDAPSIPRTPPPGRRGRGLYLVGQLTDESSVAHPWNDHRGVAVRMAKYLRRPPRNLRPL